MRLLFLWTLLLLVLLLLLFYTTSSTLMMMMIIIMMMMVANDGIRIFIHLQKRNKSMIVERMTVLLIFVLIDHLERSWLMYNITTATSCVQQQHNNDVIVYCLFLCRYFFSTREVPLGTLVRRFCREKANF